jgi:uncharacterized membrane protein YvbJ
MNEPLRCESCGHWNEPGQLSCRRCGQTLQAGPGNVMPVRSEDQFRAWYTSSRSVIPVVVGGLILLFTMAAVGFTTAIRHDKERHQAVEAVKAASKKAALEKAQKKTRPRRR